MATIELTNEQRQLLKAEAGKPINVVDPGTMERFVLLAQEQYEHLRSLLEQMLPGEPAAAVDEIPAGILHSQQAFWRELPEMLKNKKNHGKWVCYHDEERVGISADDLPLIRECLRRGLSDDAYYVTMIRPRESASWEPEEIVPIKPIHCEAGAIPTTEIGNTQGPT